MDGRGGFLHLNVENRWPGFRLSGLEIGGDGALRLERVPLLAAPVAGLADLPAPDGPAGVAVGRDGTVFYTDPGSHRLFRIDPCDGSRAPVPCFGGEGEIPTRFRTPRGLLLHPTRGALLVADSGNHRIQLLDPATFQLLDVWESFDTPWTLAADPKGNVYVVDHGSGKVRKISPRGDVIPTFEDNAHAAEVVRPVDVTFGEGEVYILDALNRIVVLDPEGRLQRRLNLPDGKPLGLLFAGEAVHVGDNASRHLLVLDPYGTRIGEAEGFDGPVAALTGAPPSPGEGAGEAGEGGRGGEGLWLHPGGSAVPVRLLLKAGHLRSGTLMGGPFGPGGRKILWHEIETLGGPLAAGAHLQLFFHTTDTSADPPKPTDDPVSPFKLPAWKPLPPDALRGLIRGAAAGRLWIGAHFASEGRQTPVLEQIRIDFDTETLALKLPSIYRTRAADPETLERFLALFESFFTDVEGETDRLARLFDAAATPPAWLPWLAGWLGLELDETWPEETKRRAIAGAFAAAARRGTPAGLCEAVRFETGVDIRVTEPILSPVGWSLAADADMEGNTEGGRLGFDTVLAAFEPEGAVAGTTAILNGSFLIDQEGPGAHLYQAVAHQFCVQVYERQVASPRRLAEVRAVIEREKPAHTAFHLCIIRPRLRIGFQARLGIDTVVAGPPTASRLGDTPALVLGGTPPGRIGEDSRIGIGTRLGAAVVDG